jgi:uncharacterized protein YukE
LFVDGTVDCRCDFGYQGDDCSNGTVFYLVVGVPAAVVFALLVALSIWGLLRLCARAKEYKVESESRERLLQHSQQRLDALERAWQIDMASIRIIKQIGVGASGAVFRGQWSGIDVAVKMLSESMREFSSNLGPNVEFENEIAQLRALRHKNIVQFYGAGVVGSANEPFIVTELCERGSLFDILSNAAVAITPLRRLGFALDAANGMLFLHSQNPVLIHRGQRGLEYKRVGRARIVEPHLNVGCLGTQISSRRTC